MSPKILLDIGMAELDGEGHDFFHESFILALLPGFEEETGEFFDKVLSLLNRLSDIVSPVFFIQNIWLIR